jgi:cyclic pyranopterin phosphate synthase
MSRKAAPKARSRLTHFDAWGSAHMVDVGSKPATQRVAVASGRILMRPQTLRIIAGGGAAKGDVLGVARIAGSRQRSARRR